METPVCNNIIEFPIFWLIAGSIIVFIIWQAFQKYRRFASDLKDVKKYKGKRKDIYGDPVEVDFPNLNRFLLVEVVLAVLAFATALFGFLGTNNITYSFTINQTCIISPNSEPVTTILPSSTPSMTSTLLPTQTSTNTYTPSPFPVSTNTAIVSLTCDDPIYYEKNMPDTNTFTITVAPDEVHVWSSGIHAVSYNDNLIFESDVDGTQAYVSIFLPINNQNNTTYELSNLNPKWNAYLVYQNCSSEDVIQLGEEHAGNLAEPGHCGSAQPTDNCREIFIRTYRGQFVDARQYEP